LANQVEEQAASTVSAARQELERPEIGGAPNMSWFGSIRTTARALGTIASAPSSSKLIARERERERELYTNGSIPYYGTYPGQYDPRPLLLCPYKGSDSTITQIASEVLSLTKINWNSTQMNQKLPIPIRAARAVGEVLKYVTDQKVSSDYARYI
jgi:hypothetical protein